jgi:hypothetical protein
LDRSRLVVAGLVGALLVATTTAFVATEALKLKRPPVGEMRGDRMLSPTCDCGKRVARVSFRLREADAVDVEVVDEDGEAVRTLAEGRRPDVGRVRFRWNGRDNAREIVPDGPYQLRVHLVQADRTVTFSRRIVVDTEPPTVTLSGLSPATVAAGGEVELRFELGEPARVVVLVDGRRATRLGLFLSGMREVDWPASRRGEALGPGLHDVSLVARDRAGNRSARTPTSSLTVLSPTA